MAVWRGEADTSVESGEGGGGGKYSAPRGFYRVQVANFEEGITKETKRPKVNLKLEIADGEHVGISAGYLTITHIPKGEKGHGLMIHQLHAFGIDVKDGAFEIDTSVFQGLQADALLEVEDYEGTKIDPSTGKPYVNQRNYVAEVYTEGHPRPAELPPEPPRRFKPRAPGAAPAADTTTKAAKSPDPVGVGNNSDLPF